MAERTEGLQKRYYLAFVVITCVSLLCGLERLWAAELAVSRGTSLFATNTVYTKVMLAVPWIMAVLYCAGLWKIARKGEITKQLAGTLMFALAFISSELLELLAKFAGAR